MSPPIIHVSAPSRLHFGMLSFGQADVRQFGGVGAMIAAPRLRLRVSAADRFEAMGPLAERALEYARRAAASWGLAEAPAARVTVLEAPPPHVGLGCGTQLGMAVAAGLNAFLGRPPLAPVELAQAVGRGTRSAIGLYGFDQGGLLVEGGKLSPNDVSPLVVRVPLPAEWRFVLLRPGADEGLSGEAERRAFEHLPPVPRETTARLTEEALLGLLPAAIEGRFDEFCDSLSRFNRLAGSCFAPRQGGLFARPELVESAIAPGARGVGQSSWGPTVFALLPNQLAADRFVAGLDERPAARPNVTITAPDNRGAVLAAGDPECGVEVLNLPCGDRT